MIMKDSDVKKVLNTDNYIQQEIPLDNYCTNHYDGIDNAIIYFDVNSIKDKMDGVPDWESTKIYNLLNNTNSFVYNSFIFSTSNPLLNGTIFVDFMRTNGFLIEDQL